MDIVIGTFIETDRTQRFWVEIIVEISLSHHLVVFFRCLVQDFVSDCHILPKFG